MSIFLAYITHNCVLGLYLRVRVRHRDVSTYIMRTYMHAFVEDGTDDCNNPVFDMYLYTRGQSGEAHDASLYAK